MRCFFDTNVLVYIFDDRAPNKKIVAQALLTQSAASDEAFISVQVLQEFYATVTRKLSPPISHAQTEEIVRELVQLKVVPSDADLILSSIATCDRYKISLWDALIIQAALRAGAEILYTEDLQDGQVFDSLTVRNPFAGIQG